MGPALSKRERVEWDLPWASDSASNGLDWVRTNAALFHLPGSDLLGSDDSANQGPRRQNSEGL